MLTDQEREHRCWTHCRLCNLELGEIYVIRFRGKVSEDVLYSKKFSSNDSSAFLIKSDIDCCGPQF